MVRRLHEVTAGLVAGAECVVHDDLQPRNVVVDGDRVVGLVDWEQARPGRRVEDVAQLCWSFGPPGRTEPVEAIARRWRRVVDVAALSDRSDVVDTAIDKIARCIADIERCARAGSARHLALRSRGDDRELRTWHDRLVVRAEELTDALR
jgi:thiamine kinase-like enzyme